MSDKEYVSNPLLKWIYPDQEAPPRSKKIALLTIGGIQTTGFWKDDDCIAWQRLFTRDKDHERKLDESRKNNKDGGAARRSERED